VSESFFYLATLLTFIYISYKFRNNIVYFLTILFFYDGLFAFYGNQIWNAYKIVLPLLSIYCASKYRVFSNVRKEDFFIGSSFLLFTVSFLIAAYLNGDHFTITFSQYAKYFNLLLLYFIFKRISVKYLFQFEKLRSLIYNLLVIQILLSIIKFLIWGFSESIVGSISYVGGSAATILPIMGFVFIYLMKDGVLSFREWVFILLLMFIGTVSMKRAMWFIMPVIILLFLYYVPKKRISKNWLIAIPVIPLAFYFAVRMNPTFNKEMSPWGSFDLSYVLNESRIYTFGSTDSQEKGQGRGGATGLLFYNMFNNEINQNYLFGYGLADMYTTSYDQFKDLGFGLNHKGSATGIFQAYVSTGYLGAILIVIFVLSILKTIREKRIRHVIILLFLWEYFLYAGNIIRNPAIILLLAFVISFANQKYFQKQSRSLPENYRKML
jgi:hypothetical protein